MSKLSQERTKVVVRNLPPTLAAEAFRSTIDKLAEGSYDWFVYYPGKVSLKRAVFSRAFLNFNTPEAVINFKNKFDGHVFISTRGTQYRCSVEYAMFQKVPTANPKKLAMEGTIDKDADYQAFVKVLEEGPKAVPTAQAQLEAQEAAHTGEASGPVVTALMAFLQKKYESTPFTGRRGSRASRKRDGAKLASLLEEESDSSKTAKGRSKSSRSSRVTAEEEAATTAAAVAAATAAASGAAAHAVKGGKQKPSKHVSKQRGEGAEESAVRDKKPGKSARESGAEAASDDKAPKLKQKHSRQAAAVSEAAGAASSTAVASQEQDAEAKRAAAAALAAASAVNAAAAARKSRVKAGHQVYTPGARAGGRLFAAALPKGGAAGDAGDKSTSTRESRHAADAGSSTHPSRPAATKGVTQAPVAAEGSSRNKVGHAGKRGVAAPTAAAAAGDASVGTASAGSTCTDSSRAAAADDDDDDGTRGGRGGRGRGRGGSAGRQQQQQQAQQQMWMPKTGGAG